MIEIFYSEIEAKPTYAEALREQALPLPRADEGYSRVLLLGAPGAGKTTLLRQLIGTHPVRERFPSTSVNRTTTFPTEIITRDGGYKAVVSFLSEHQVRFEIEESVSAGILEAAALREDSAARAFLEQSDMRFRLKYLLGDFSEETDDEDDPYADSSGDEFPLVDSPEESIAVEQTRIMRERLERFVGRLSAIARSSRAKVEQALGPIDQMPSEHRSTALDLVQEEAQGTDEFVELVSDILDELREKFDLVTAGVFERTSTGWPTVWHMEVSRDDRGKLLSTLRTFTGIGIQSWGHLLTPLVNGVRVCGPFYPANWSDGQVPLVLIDTEGIGHKANQSADLPAHLVRQMNDVDVIVLVESAKTAMSNLSSGKALEAAVTAGQTRKLAIAFTHMDVASGENLRGRAKLQHIFGGVRNVVENQLAKSVSTDAARYLLHHLEKNTFYLGRIDKVDATPAHKELRRLLERLAEGAPKRTPSTAEPEYSTDTLAFAIQEAAQAFRNPWKAWLGFEQQSGYRPYAWQSIKALTRRYAEGWDDGYALRPSSNLLNALTVAVSRFLETPTRWSGNPTEDQKREYIDAIKAKVSASFATLSELRLKKLPQPNWATAYGLRGTGSTFQRRVLVENIFERWVPIPTGAGDEIVQEFLDEVKNVVISAIEASKPALEFPQFPGHIQ